MRTKDPISTPVACYRHPNMQYLLSCDLVGHHQHHACGMLHVLGATIPPHTNPLQFTDQAGRISAAARRVRSPFGQTRVLNMRAVHGATAGCVGALLGVARGMLKQWQHIQSKLRLSRLLVPACTKGQPMVCEKLEGWRGSSFPRPLPGARSPFGDVFGRCLATRFFSAHFRRLGRRGRQPRPAYTRISAPQLAAPHGLAKMSGAPRLRRCNGMIPRRASAKGHFPAPPLELPGFLVHHTI